MRLDRLIVDRGLAASRQRAQGLIRAGVVLVDGAAAARIGQLVSPEVPLTITGEPLPYVGRGGLKLESALRRFRLNANGARCLDVGAGTGGFTDCLLQRGAAHVIAMDVGHGQMAQTLRDDARVDVREGVNARNLTTADVPEPVDLAVIDVAFISLTLVLPAVAALVRPGGTVLALIKPQYEAGRAAVGPGGIVRGTKDRQRAVQRVQECAERLGLLQRGIMAVPQTMARGNLEFIACLRVPATPAEAAAESGAPLQPEQVVF